MSALFLALLGASARAEFGIETVEVRFEDESGGLVTQAGSHPFAWATELAMRSTVDQGGKDVPDGDLKSLRMELPPGLIGSTASLPRCLYADLLVDSCAMASAVGRIQVTTNRAGTEGDEALLYGLEPRYGSVAEFGANVLNVPVTMKITVDPDPPHGLIVSLDNLSQVEPVFGASLTVSGSVGGEPLVTLPRTCETPLVTRFEAESWQQPGRWVADSALNYDGVPPDPLGLSGCDQLEFDPRLTVTPSVSVGRSPSGLDLAIDVDDEGMRRSDVAAAADVRDIRLSLPEGLTLNAAFASGLRGCTVADVEREAPTSAFGEGCPAAAKIGTAEVTTPLLTSALPGILYLAEPDDPGTASPGAENPFDTRFAFYVVIKDPARGVLVAQPGKLAVDPGTGRLLVTVGDLPQLPISHLELHLRAGDRAPLRSPEGCGSFLIDFRLTPWSGSAPLEGTSSFAIDRGCGSADFDPRVVAGTSGSLAGSSSPFVFDLRRGGGEQNPAELSIALPPGLAANLRGVQTCPERESSAGGCPAASRVGSLDIAIGSGASPLWLPVPPGRAPVFLGGPYKGAPFSLVLPVPAEAGPFDLGSVVVRAAVRIDRRSGGATVALDPLPQILDGVPIEYRAIHLELDRPGFIRHPTSCARMRFLTRVDSDQGAVAKPASFFQASRCDRLGFRPKLVVALLGSPRRGAHPRLRVTMATRRGDANIRRTGIVLPGTELLDNTHIRGVCSVAELAVRSCPKSAIYGHARASSPLLDEPLEGFVYLRSGKHRLPDLVVALGGKVELDLVARIDAVRGRLRVTFDALPDFPLGKLVVTMWGGDRGLLVNTAGVCRGERRAGARSRGQNGKRYLAAPRMKTGCARGAKQTKTYHAD